MFEYAPGAPRKHPTAEEAALLGQVLAGIHQVADERLPSGPRYHLDERYLVDQPLRELSAIGLEPSQRAFLEDLAAELRDKLRSFPRTPPSYGYIHADFHLQNMHFDDDGSVKVFDFDHSAIGWRSYDLYMLRHVLDDAAWEGAVAGYQSVQALPHRIDDLRTLYRLRVLWDLGDRLAAEHLWGHGTQTPHIKADLTATFEVLAK